MKKNNNNNSVNANCHFLNECVATLFFFCVVSENLIKTFRCCFSPEHLLLIDNIGNCNANFSGFSTGVDHVQAYANEQLLKSYDYLLLAANFGTYVKNRPGFEKQFRALSDSAWERSIDLIKHITKRGGQHNFARRRSVTVSTQGNRVSELNEIDALAFALDTEKSLALEAHSLHERYSHANHKSRYDAEVQTISITFLLKSVF